MFTVPCLRFHVYCYTFTVSRSLFHVHCFTFTVSRLLLHVYCYMFTVTCLLLHVYCYTFTVTRLLPKSFAEKKTPNGTFCLLALTVSSVDTSKLTPLSSLFPPIRRALRVERSFRDVEDDDMLPRSLQDGLRDSYVSSAPLKPPLAHSLLIKEELLSQKHRLLGQPPALSLASLEAAGLLNHGNKGNHVEPHPLLARDGSPWGSSSGKTHHHQLDSLLRLKQASAILSDLQDLPLEPGGHHSPPVDLKIPQVRGMDLSWDSHASDLYGYGAMVLGAGGHGGVENALSRKLRVILPKQNRRAGSLRGSLGGFLDGAADYWNSDVDQGTSGQPYPTSDPEGDPCSKQPRKKRGRYRQYNSQILEEAIGMVMGGKMSVSKAQNMYGIPHSTLEYKVKERLGTLKNPPKKKLKLTLRMGGQDSAAESETTPTATPREVAPPEAADLNHEQKMKMEFED
uniref:HTH psq-type domain-containing protein n=1 Tax=Oncorhynchus kisutch TaxID=8019 RepID=A0A8C7HCY3_ONCKI